MPNKITKDASLAKLLANPKAKEILVKYNLPCLGCPYAQFEMDKLKISDVCKMYNIDIEVLLKELNKV